MQLCVKQQEKKNNNIFKQATHNFDSSSSFFPLCPPSPTPRIELYLKVYLPREEGTCASAPVQLVNMGGEDSAKLICACP